MRFPGFLVCPRGLDHCIPGMAPVDECGSLDGAARAPGICGSSRTSLCEFRAWSRNFRRWLSDDYCVPMTERASIDAGESLVIWSLEGCASPRASYSPHDQAIENQVDYSSPERWHGPDLTRLVAFPLNIAGRLGDKSQTYSDGASNDMH
jgi:hypothetical protein